LRNGESPIEGLHLAEISFFSTGSLKLIGIVVMSSYIVIRKKPVITRRWLVLRIKPRAEKRVYGRLKEKGIEVFLPLHKQLRCWSDRRKWVDEPLFPGYIFVYVNPSEEDRALYTPGVTRYVRFGNVLAVVREEEIASIRHLVEAGVPLKVIEEHIEPGDCVEITWGPLRGFQGEVVAWRGKRRVAIRVEAIMKTVVVDVPVEKMTKVA